MRQPPLFLAILFVWFFAWALLLLRFPRQCHRIASWGKEPSAWNLKVMRVVGYMGLFFGAVLALELAFGIVRAN